MLHSPLQVGPEVGGGRDGADAEADSGSPLVLSPEYITNWWSAGRTEVWTKRHMTNFQQAKQVFMACKSDKLELVKEVAARPGGVNLSAWGTCQLWTPLHVAAHHGSNRLVSYLLGRGAVRNSRDRAGRSPLQLAELAGHTNCAKMLLAHAARPTPSSPVSRPPSTARMLTTPPTRSRTTCPHSSCTAAVSASVPQTTPSWWRSSQTGPRHLMLIKRVEIIMFRKCQKMLSGFVRLSPQL